MSQKVEKNMQQIGKNLTNSFVLWSSWSPNRLIKRIVKFETETIFLAWSFNNFARIEQNRSDPVATLKLKNVNWKLHYYDMTLTFALGLLYNTKRPGLRTHHSFVHDFKVPRILSQSARTTTDGSFNEFNNSLVTLFFSLL